MAPNIGYPRRPRLPPRLTRSGPVTAAVPAIQAHRVSAAPAQPEVLPEVGIEEVAVEPAVGEIAGQANGEPLAPAVDGARGHPERVVVDVAQEIGPDPPDSPQRPRAGRQVEIDPVGPLKHRFGLEPGEAAEGVAEDAEHTVGLFPVGDLQWPGVGAQVGAERAQTPVEPVGLIDVERRRVEVVDNVPDVPALVRGHAHQHHVIAQQVAEVELGALQPTDAGDHGRLAGREVQGQVLPIGLVPGLGGHRAVSGRPGPLPGRLGGGQGERLRPGRPNRAGSSRCSSSVHGTHPPGARSVRAGTPGQTPRSRRRSPGARCRGCRPRTR